MATSRSTNQHFYFIATDEPLLVHWVKTIYTRINNVMLCEKA